MPSLNAAFQGRGEQPWVLETKLDVCFQCVCPKIAKNGPVNGEKHDERIVFSGMGIF